MTKMTASGGWHADGAIRVLGDAAITAGGQTRRVELSTNAGLVLAVLVARRNERVGIDELIDLLWPSRPPPTARKGVHVTILRLRDLLDPDRSQRDGGASPIIGHPDAYELSAAPRRIDAAWFESLLRAGQRALTDGDPVTASARFAEAIATWGEPFGDGGPAAVAAYVDHLRTAHRIAATGLLETQVRLGTEDVATLERAVAADPYDERRWGLLMVGLFRQGRQAAALEAYQRARHLLVDELGLEPGPYLRNVEEQVLLQDGPLLAVHGPGTGATLSLDWPGPPPSPGPLLLRDEEVLAVERQLERWRTVTVVGPPGVGKTSLALAIASTRQRDAVAWASLTSVPPGASAAVDIAMRLGVASEASSNAEEFGRLLAQRVGDRAVLVVLDNAEHLVESVTPLVDTLTRSCPNLTVLVTSRRPLGVRGEQIVRLQPFATADEAATGSSPAVLYLAERAALGRPGKDERVALERIGRHVGGLALGLEHAAARLRALTPTELADRLELLDDPGADGLGRAIDWSISLLGADEVAVLRTLSHLEADWGLDRAEAAAGRRGLGALAVRNAVASLLGHSLVAALDDGATVRRRIIEPVRHHVRGLAAADGDSDACAAACAEAVADEVAAAAALLEGGDQRAGITTMRELMPDVRRAVIWGTGIGAHGLVARILARLRSWWWISGLYADAQTLHALADAPLEAWRPDHPDHAHERLRALASGVTTRPGFAAPARRADDLVRYLDEAERIGAPPDVTSWAAQLLSSGLSFTNRDPVRAVALARRAIEDADRVGDGWLRAWGLYALAIARGRDDPAEGLSYLEQSAFGFAEKGDRLHAARVLMFLGHGARIFGDPRNAGDAFAQAEAWCVELGAAPVTQLDCELGRACSAELSGDDVTAAAMYRTLVPRLWSLGDYRCAAVAQRNLGAVLFRQGDVDGARALTLRSIEILRGLPGEEADLGTAQILRGEIALADGQLELAARILGRAEALAAGGGGVPMELRDYDRLRLLREVVSQRLGPERTDALASAGAGDDVL